MNLFSQLISAVSYLLAKNIALKDITLDSIFLDESGNLKVYDLCFTSNPSELEPSWLELNPHPTFSIREEKYVLIRNLGSILFQLLTFKDLP